MAGKKQVIRRLERSGVADFDEQLWPINCALLALAGFVAGVIIATSQFDGGPFWSHGYFRLALLGITVVAMLAATAWLHRKKAVRRMQLAVLLSLLLNLGIEFWLYRTYLDLTVEAREQTSEWIDETEIVTLPDYGRQPSEELIIEEALERPVETATPQTMPEEVERQPLERQPTPSDRPSMNEPARQATEAATATLQRAPSPTSAPRQADARSGPQISRQSASLPTPPLQTIPQPTASSTAPALDTPLEAQAPAMSRQSTAAPQLQRRPPTAELAEAPSATASPQAARAERSETAPQLTATAPLGTRATSEAASPSAEAPAASVAAASPAAAAPSNLQPSNAQVARQQAAAPSPAPAEAASAAATSPTADVTASTVDNARAASRSEPSPSALAGAAPTLPREATSPAAASLAAEAAMPAAPAAAASGEAAALDAAPAAEVVRQSQTGPTARRLADATGTAPAVGPQVARTQMNRAGIRADVNGSSSTAPNAIARAVTSSAATAPTTAESPGVGAAVVAQGTAPSLVANAQATAAGRTSGIAPLPTNGQAAATLPGNARNTAELTASQPRRATTGDDDAAAHQGLQPSAAAVPERVVAQAGIGSATSQAIAEPGAGVTASDSPSPLSASVAGQARRAADLPSSTPTGIGPASTAVTRTPSALPGLPTGLSRATGAEAEPQAATAVGAPASRDTSAASLPAGLADADDPGPVASGSSDASLVASLQGPAMDNVARRQSGMSPVELAAVEGPGGLSREFSPQVGLPNRRARPDSEAIHQVAERFLMSRSSTTATIDGKAFDTPSPAFNQRTPEQREATARTRGGSSGSERAVEMGLAYLAKQQLGDGRWSLQNVATGGVAADQISAGRMQADTAATGMALLCYLGAGYTHTDGKYRDAVGAGLAHLVAHQKADGDLFSGGSKYVWFYSHGIAAIALCEAYGMTGDRALRGPAQKALDFIVASQHPDDGGWRYSPGSGTDTSVSGWQMMALKSGELAGLTVPPKAYDGVRKWLDIAQGPSGSPSRYSYRPASTIAHQRQPSAAMTAEGLLMRLYTGWPRTDPRVLDGAEFLKQRLPAIGTRTNPERDAYYWYYATQVMFQVQGEPWNAWNERMRSVLLPSQVQNGPLAGSWDPRGTVSDRWGIEAGRIYVTSMHLLMLEVYYRHLPLYKIK